MLVMSFQILTELLVNKTKSYNLKGGPIMDKSYRFMIALCLPNEIAQNKTNKKSDR